MALSHDLRFVYIKKVEYLFRYYLLGLILFYTWTLVTTLSL